MTKEKSDFKVDLAAKSDARFRCVCHLFHEYPDEDDWRATDSVMLHNLEPYSDRNTS
jgi:hypothetical protein